MHITQEMRQQACEGLLHFTPKKVLARELGLFVGSIRDWAIYAVWFLRFGRTPSGATPKRRRLLVRAFPY